MFLQSHFEKQCILANVCAFKGLQLCGMQFIHLITVCARVIAGLKPRLPHGIQLRVKALNGRLPHEDSSDFDDSWTELIVVT